VMGVGSNPSWYSRQGDGKFAVLQVPDADLQRFPVECVSWTTAVNIGFTYNSLRRM
jgi:hypothetical protein